MAYIIKRKTFWSVKYGVWGAWGTCTAWFDNKEEAEEFARRDYTDRPIAHTYTRADSIERAEVSVAIEKNLRENKMGVWG